MKKVLITTIVLLGGLAVFFVLNSFSHRTVREGMRTPPDNAVYKDPSASFEDRARDLLSYMTLQEKIGQMTLVEKNSLTTPVDLVTYNIGGLLSGMGAKPQENTKEGWKEMVETYIAQSKANRLGIPILYGADAIHGHSNVPEATIFPHAMALGAANDPDLVEEIAKATAREMKATGIVWNFAPNLDLPQDIRWGRVYEAFSDDPTRAKELGAAYIRGMHTKEAFVLATPKHYLGAGSMIFNSSSNPEYLIDQGTTPGSETQLRLVYLPPFLEAVNAGAYSVLIGLNAWGAEDAAEASYDRFENVAPESLRKLLLKQSRAKDQKVSASSYLITDVLKGELGFEGFAVSDWYGVYEIPGGDYTAAVTAINAGIDMVMLPFDYKPFISNVKKAVEKGDIDESRIDDAVFRILRAKFAAGLFDEQNEVSLSVVGSQAHRSLAREAVASSLVLLKNEGDILPLSPSVSHIRVAGSAADNVGMQSGGWTVEWQGIDGNGLPNSTSILEGITRQAGEAALVEYDKDGVFATSSRKAQVGIAVVGERPYAEGFGDSNLPILTQEDRDALTRLQDSSERVVVILVSGRPLLVTGEVPSWDAFVMAWLPGSEGAGVSDVLFGVKPFEGTLPIPYPAYTEQLPLSSSGSAKDGTQVLYPRGFGLQTDVSN